MFLGGDTEDDTLNTHKSKRTSPDHAAPNIPIITSKPVGFMQRCPEFLSDLPVDDMADDEQMMLSAWDDMADDICHPQAACCLISHQISPQTTLRTCTSSAGKSGKNSGPLYFAFKEQTPLLKSKPVGFMQSCVDDMSFARVCGQHMDNMSSARVCRCCLHSSLARFHILTLSARHPHAVRTSSTARFGET